MKINVYGMSDAELFRLVTAYIAVRDPKVRKEFLRAVEAWARDQWDTAGSSPPRPNNGG